MESYEIIDLGGGHALWEDRNKHMVRFRCTRGWSCWESRKQNAWARAKKMKAKLYRHMDWAAFGEDDEPPPA